MHLCVCAQQPHFQFNCTWWVLSFASKLTMRKYSNGKFIENIENIFWWPNRRINVTSAKNKTSKLKSHHTRKLFRISASKADENKLLPIRLVLFGIGGWKPLIFDARLNRINTMNSMRYFFWCDAERESKQRGKLKVNSGARLPSLSSQYL